MEHNGTWSWLFGLGQHECSSCTCMNSSMLYDIVPWLLYSLISTDIGTKISSHWGVLTAGPAGGANSIHDLFHSHRPERNAMTGKFVKTLQILQSKWCLQFHAVVFKVSSVLAVHSSTLKVRRKHCWTHCIKNFRAGLLDCHPYSLATRNKKRYREAWGALDLGPSILLCFSEGRFLVIVASQWKKERGMEIWPQGWE